MKLLEKLTFGLKWLAALAMALMMFHVLADVVGRQLFKAPAPATSEMVAYYYMVAAVFLPLPFVELHDRSIAVDLFYKGFPTLLRKISLLFATAAGAIFFGMLALKSSSDAVAAYQKWEMIEGISTIAIWPMRFLLPIAFGTTSLILVLRFVLQGIFGRDLRTFRSEPGNLDHEAI